MPLWGPTNEGHTQKGAYHRVGAYTLFGKITKGAHIHKEGAMYRPPKGNLGHES